MNAQRVLASRMIFVALLSFAFAANANAGTDALTILVHDTVAVDQLADRYDRPESSFHDWGEAVTEANAIVVAWETDPVTVPWTRIQLGRHVKHKVSPTLAARGLALTHVAMNDAYQLAKAQNLDVRLAVSEAAATVLGYLYPAEEKAFERISFAVATDTVDGSPPGSLEGQKAKSLNLGRLVGLETIAYAKQDGADYGWDGRQLQWYGEGRFFGPGAWVPTPPYYYYPPSEPYGQFWKPWRLKSADQFRPAPPAFGSERFRADLQEVVQVAHDLTPEQLRIGWMATDPSRPRATGIRLP